MKALAAFFAVCLVSGIASANDGGIAAIKVSNIKMRQMEIKNGKENIVQKIVNPSYDIIFEGGEAAKLQKILPSDVSVITGMQPELAKDYNETFKSLGIWSEPSAEATSKAITISCTNGDLVPVPGQDGKMKIVKSGKTTCKISIRGYGKSDMAADTFGDPQTFEPKTCQ